MNTQQVKIGLAYLNPYQKNLPQAQSSQIKQSDKSV